MLKSKDFYYKAVYRTDGKRLGAIKDICINFFKSKIEGFKIATNSLFNKSNFISVESIEHFGEKIIAKDAKKEVVLGFKEIKGIEILTLDGNLKGVLEDIIINENLEIIGLVITTGILEKFINGKEILLIDDCILGDEFMIFNGSNNVKMVSICKEESIVNKYIDKYVY